MPVCLYVHPSVHKKFFQFQPDFVCTRDGMPYDPIQGQGQGHRGPKVAKMTDFKVYLIHVYLTWYACNQWTNGEL